MHRDKYVFQHDFSKTLKIEETTKTDYIESGFVFAKLHPYRSML